MIIVHKRDYNDVYFIDERTKQLVLNVNNVVLNVNTEQIDKNKFNVIKESECGGSNG